MIKQTNNTIKEKGLSFDYLKTKTIKELQEIKQEQQNFNKAFSKLLNPNNKYKRIEEEVLKEVGL